MVDLPQIVGALSSTVVVFGALFGIHKRGAIGSWFRSGSAASSLTVANIALATYETRIKQQDLSLANLQTLVASQGHQIDLLKELVTSRAAVDELAGRVDAYHQAILHELSKITAAQSTFTTTTTTSPAPAGS